MRDIIEVIENVAGVVPATEELFKSYLNSLKKDCLYTAPEAMHEKWMHFGQLFCRYVPYPPTEEWHKLAVKHFTGEEFNDKN